MDPGLLTDGQMTQMSGVKGLSVYYPFLLSLFLSPQYFCLCVGEGFVFRPLAVEV